MVIRKRIFLGFGIIILISALQGLYLFRNTVQISNSVETVFSKPFKAVETVHEASLAFQHVRDHMSSIALMTTPVSSDESLKIFDARFEKYHEALVQLEHTILSTSSRLLLNEVHEVSDQWQINSILMLGATPTTTIPSPHRMKKLELSISNKLDALVHSTLKDAVTLKDEISAKIEKSKFIEMISIVVIVIAGGLVAFIIGMGIVRPLDRLKRTMSALAEGRFETAIADTNRKDGIGEMAMAVEVFRANSIARAELEEAGNRVHQRLVTSVNSMRNGFVIWDAKDRLVLANEAYLGFHDSVREIIVEGVQFKDILLAGLAKNIWNLEEQNEPDWLIEQLNRREVEQGERVLKLADHRRIVISDLVLDNGDVISTIIDITAHSQREMEMQDAKDQLEQIAYFDTLTGLANRLHCQKDMARYFNFGSEDKKFAIIQIDLDNFKRVNDTLGHAAGDHLLKVLGDRMSLLAREYGNFRSYRWGGDEFIALVDRDEGTNLAAICEELTDLIAIPLQHENSVLRPTVSLGVARYPEDAEDLESLMIFSDLALYRTKELGRDGYQFFTSEMKEKVDTESRIERELRIAMEEDQLELFYQPQLAIDDESITGIEALVRWNHPSKGLIGPGEFLSISEATGLAPALGCKLFEYAMKAVRSWVDDGLVFGRLAVNLSPEHLKRNTILTDFFDVMEQYRVEPQHLAVEFLESFILDDPNANIMDILQQFRARGIHVELDDFGTGYASLSHLSTMPITGLKIDKTFVDQMTDDERQQGIVSALISISKLMKLRVVCEGIETRQQVDAIAKIGKCSIQGYHISKPMKFEDMTRWMRESRNVGSLRDQAVAAKTISNR